MTDKIKVAIIGCGYLPNPAVLGGAVETLVDYVIEENERSAQLDLTIFSISNNLARQEACKYQKTEFRYLDVPKPATAIDKAIYFFAKNILKKSNAISYRYIIQRLCFIFKVAKELRNADFDRIVLENHPTLLLSLKPFGNLSKYKDKVIYHMHNEVRSLYGCDKELKSCWRIAGVSDYVNKVISANCGPLVSNDQLRVLRNRVDTAKFEKAVSNGARKRVRNKLGIQEGETMIMFSGRVCPDKGVIELVKAFADSKLANCKLVVIGAYYFDSGLRTEYEDKIRKAAAPMGDKIIFTGYVKHDLIPEYYAAADVVCVPSVWDDPAPLAVVEAVSAGKKLVTTQSGGIPEYARYGDSIVVARGPEMVSNLADALREAILTKQRAVKRPEGWCRQGFYDDFVNLVTTGEVMS